jgi:hypothetical protein
MKLATARLLVGRTIVAFDNGRLVDPDDGRLHYQPTFTLDNGARVTFSVTETDQGGWYGITPSYHSKKPRTAKASR